VRCNIFADGSAAAQIWRVEEMRVEQCWPGGGIGVLIGVINENVL
jgi:hypothetical protein